MSVRILLRPCHARPNINIGVERHVRLENQPSTPSLHPQFFFMVTRRGLELTLYRLAHVTRGIGYLFALRYLPREKSVESISNKKIFKKKTTKNKKAVTGIRCAIFNGQTLDLQTHAYQMIIINVVVATVCHNDNVLRPVIFDFRFQTSGLFNSMLT